MSVPEFNLTAEALRNAMILYVDVSEQTGTWNASAAVWEPQGYKTEESSLEFNPDVTKVTDILGDTYANVNKLERKMSFEPNTIRPIANRGKLNQQLHEIVRRNQLSKLSEFKVLLAYGYTGTPGTSHEADLYPLSTIEPTSLGGASRVDFPFTVHLGGEAIYGKVDQMLPEPTFTPEA